MGLIEDGIVRKNSPLNVITILGIVFGMFFLPYYAAKEMVRGHRRGPVATIVKTVFLNIVIAFLGLVFAMTVTEGNSGLAALIFLTSLAVGIVVGLVKRARFKVQLHNEAFLTEQGFIATGLVSKPYQDGQGNSVKLLDPKDRKITVMFVDKSGFRGVIELDGAGRMTSYSGPISLKAAI